MQPPRAHYLRAWTSVIETLDAVRSAAEGPQPVDAGEAPIPVTLLCGFLGAGKTTIVKELLLADQHKAETRNIAVLVNDVSALVFDAAQIATQTDQVVTLNNGCVCCSMLGDAEQALSAQAAAIPRPDAIVVELSGVSDAFSMALLIEQHTRFKFDGVVGVVDAQTIMATLCDPQLGDAVRSQLSAAHIVVANKADLIDDATLIKVTTTLGQVAPGRPVIAARFGRIPMEILLSAASRGARPPSASTKHSIPYAETVVVGDAVVSAKRLEKTLRLMPGGLLRIKGWCEVDDPRSGPTPQASHARAFWMEVQMVGRRWTMTRGDEIRRDQTRQDKSEADKTRAAKAAVAMRSGLTVIATDATALDAICDHLTKYLGLQRSG